jgi:hypothetical protein
MHLTPTVLKETSSCFYSWILTRTLMGTDCIGQLSYLRFHMLPLDVSPRTAHEPRPHTLFVGPADLIVLVSSGIMCYRV